VQLAGVARLRLDDLGSEPDGAAHLCFPVGNVDVEMDRHLDGRGLRHALEEELRAIAARERVAVAGIGLVAEQLSPERGQPLRVFGRKRDVVQPQHRRALHLLPVTARELLVEGRLSRYTRAAPPGWG
jgi:hypothetical protein